MVMDAPSDFYSDRVFVSYTSNNEMYFCGADDRGYPTRMRIGLPTATGFEQGGTFFVDGVECYWREELLTDLHPITKRHFTWECVAAVPLNSPPLPPSLQSPRYRAEMDRRARVSLARSKSQTRVLPEAVVEDVDPLAIFTRDEWMCQLCGTEVDRTLRYPDPRSASLDHVAPLARGGAHLPDNCQLAHLSCNSRKGAR